MQGLQPIFSIVSAVFSPLVPIFDAIISALSTVWDWFTKLFEPIQFSTEALKSCTSAGESFGKIVGDAISLVLWPVEQLWKVWIWYWKNWALSPIRQSGPKSR